MKVVGWVAALALAMGLATGARAATVEIADGGSYAFDPDNSYHAWAFVSQEIDNSYTFDFGSLVTQTLVVTWHIPSDPESGAWISDLTIGWGSDLHAVTDANGNSVEDAFVLTAGPGIEQFFISGLPQGGLVAYDVTISAAPVAHMPIPSAALLFGSVLAGAGVWRVRRKKAGSARTG